MKYIYQLTILLAILSIASCSDMNELHEVYYEDGEIIYAAKVDYVFTQPGKERIQLDLYLLAQRVETVRIYWNDKTDSTDVAIEGQTGMFYPIIENLPEKSYIFQCVSLDEFGNRSLEYEVTSKVYGDIYQSGLMNRYIATSVQDVDDQTDVLVLSWTTLSELDRGVTVNYTNSSGEAVELLVAPEEGETHITDWMPESTLTFSTIYVPEEWAIDTFNADSKEVTLPAI